MRARLRLSRSWLARARSERASLPKLRLFVVVLARSAARRLAFTRRRPTAAARLSRNASALQPQPVYPDEILALAADCRAAGTTLRISWPPDAPHDEFAAWHRAAILAGLLGVVEIVAEADPEAPNVTSARGS
jgi:hypothetical protein